jgi:hypothetical protein
MMAVDILGMAMAAPLETLQFHPREIMSPMAFGFKGARHSTF